LPKRLLVIAGSDSSSGAGIQADLKTASAFGAYAMTAITAVTAQDTTGVHAVHLVPAHVVRDQIACCLKDIGADAIKIGMLGSGEITSAVADVLEENARGIPLVLDPVLKSTSGMPLLDDAGIEILKSRLIPLATLVTPNLPELEALAHGENPHVILEMGAQAVLVKGGHVEGSDISDFLYTRETMSRYKKSRLDTSSTHGTGCTLATAIACGLAEGVELSLAVSRARNYVQNAIETAPGLGKGFGPLNHSNPARRNPSK